MEKSNESYITLKLVETFVKGNPFERFYKESTRGFSYREKAFLENCLVDSTGRRNSISESEFLHHVPNGKKLLEGDSRILQRTSVSSDGSDFRVELIHDSFCAPLAELKRKRKQHTRVIGVLTAFGLAVLVIIGVLFYNARLSAALIRTEVAKNEAEIAKDEAEIAKNEAERQAKVANEQTLRANENQMKAEDAKEALIQKNRELENERKRLTLLTKKLENEIQKKQNAVAIGILGRLLDNATSTLNNEKNYKQQDTYTDRLAALEFLPVDSNTHFSIPPSVEAALRRTCRLDNTLLATGNYKEGYIRSMAISPDGKKLAYIKNKQLHFLSVESGLEERVVPLNTYYSSLSFSPDGSYLITPYCLLGLDGVRNDSLNPCIRSLYLGFNRNYIEIEALSSRKQLRSERLVGHHGKVNSAKYSPDSSMIVSTSNDSTVRIWKGMNIVRTFRDHKAVTLDAAFGFNGKDLVTVGKDSLFNIYHLVDNSAKVGKDSISVFLPGSFSRKFKNGYAKSATFSPNSEFVAFTLNTNVVLIYDIINRKDIFISHKFDRNIESVLFCENNRIIVNTGREVQMLDFDGGGTTKYISNWDYPISSFDVSKDGKKVISTSQSWDGVTLDILTTGGQANHMLTIGFPKFSPDGNTIISLCGRQLHQWNIEEGGKSAVGRMTPLKREVDVFFIKGDYLITNNEDTTTTVLNASTLSEKYTIEGNITSDICERKNLFLTNDPKSTLVLRELSSGREMKRLNRYGITKSKFSSKGTYVASCDSNGFVTIWSVTSGQELVSFKGSKFSLFSFSPSEKLFAYTTESKCVVWNLTSNKESAIIQEVQDYQEPFFSPDDKYIVCGMLTNKKNKYDIKLISLSNVHEQKCLAKGVSTCFYKFSPDFRKLALSYNSNYPCLKIIATEDWCVEDSLIPSRYKTGYEGFDGLDFSLDGNRLLSPNVVEKKVYMWDSVRHKGLKSYDIYESLSFTDARFSPDNNKWALLTNDNTIQIWDSIQVEKTRRGSEINYHLQSTIDEFKSQNNRRVANYVFSPDGESLLTITRDSLLCLWNTRTGRILHSWKPRNYNWWNGASFSPNGKSVIVPIDSTTCILDIRKDDVARRLEGHQGRVHYAISSPSGNYIASYSSDDKTIRIWNVLNGNEEKCIDKISNVYGLSFSHDDRYLLVSSSKVCVWDWKSVKLFDELDAIGEATFTKDDNKIIVTSTSDKSVKTFDFLPINELIRETRKRFQGRKLTPEERIKYHFDEYEELN